MALSQPDDAGLIRSAAACRAHLKESITPTLPCTVRTAFERISKRLRGFPSETHVKRGVRVPLQLQVPCTPRLAAFTLLRDACDGEVPSSAALSNPRRASRSVASRATSGIPLPSAGRRATATVPGASSSASTPSRCWGLVRTCFAERWVSTVRRELLEHLGIFSARYVEAVISPRGSSA